jgi:hypothetical protein
MAFTLPVNIQDTCNGVIYCFAKWANDVTNGLFWVGILTAFVVVIFISVQRFGVPRAYGFSSVVGMLAAIWFATMQLIAWWAATLFILAGIAGFAVLIINER